MPGLNKLDDWGESNNSAYDWAEPTNSTYACTIIKKDRELMMTIRVDASIFLLI